MKYIGIGMTFFLAFLLQGTGTVFPLLLPLLLLLYTYYRALWVFFIAFFVGIFLDVLLVYPVGEHSLFFLSFLFLVFLYQRKFEIGSYYFVFLSLFTAVFVYAWMFDLSNGFFIAFFCALLGIGAFYLEQKVFSLKKKKSYLLR